jgi:hypothetical protein
VQTQWLDWRLVRRDWSKELAYALRAWRASSESWAGSVVPVEDAALCMEKRLDCELEGVRTVRGAGTWDRTSDEKSVRVGVVPYG